MLRVEVSHEAAEATEAEARAAVNATIPERAIVMCVGMKLSGQDGQRYCNSGKTNDYLVRMNECG